VLSHGLHRPRPSCPSRSGARQATPRRFHRGTEPSAGGSTPWRRCGVWIHDPVRRLMGARPASTQDTARMLYSLRFYPVIRRRTKVSATVFFSAVASACQHVPARVPRRPVAPAAPPLGPGLKPARAGGGENKRDGTARGVEKQRPPRLPFERGR
jgi:hypothetical protein